MTNEKILLYVETAEK